MCLEQVRGGESFLTDRTNVRSTARMNEHVSIQRGLLDKTATTKFAKVRCLKIQSEDDVYVTDNSK